MSGWQPQYNQQQGGVPQYPMQTGMPMQGGMPPMQTGFGGMGMNPQQTGFPGQRPQFQQPHQGGFQQPQQTGFPQSGFQPPQSGFQRPQPTGFQQPQQTGFPAQPSFQHRAAPPPPVPPVPAQFQQNQSTLAPPQSQPQRFGNASPSFGGGILSQQTGFPGSGGLVPQMTGAVDPRLYMMSSTLMPANPSMPFAGGAPQFATGIPQQQGMSLQQGIQEHNQAQRGTTAPKMPWNLSRGEKKQYDQLFRAWDNGSGFISGNTALEVFGQSGLEKNDLAKVWSLADQDNRGKLNLAEFHVAMGIIFRRLNGNEIPDVLPPELVPPSSKGLEDSVTFVKDILKHDNYSRATTTETPVSYAKSRSWNESTPQGAGGRKDGTVYKHDDDSSDSGGIYKSRARRLDRSTVRATGEDGPAADLSDMKRALENTARMLDDSSRESATRTREDEALERETEDLKYRVRRLQDDLEYASRGPRTVARDEERRKLERELLHLMHERLPEVEKKIQERDRRKKEEERDWARERDRRNDRFGRYDDRDTDRSYGSSRYEDRDRERDRERDRSRERDRGYMRGTYDRDDRDYRDRDRDRDRHREDRQSSPPAKARSPPPAPPAAPSEGLAKPPPPPAPSASPAPHTKNMSPEERKAFIRAEAQRRTQERMRALGVLAPGTSGNGSAVDDTVEDRLEKERQEKEARAKQAEKEAEERERARKERLEAQKALKNGPSASPIPPTPPVPAASTRAPAPPPPKARAPPPKPAPRGSTAKSPPPTRTTAPPIPVASPTPPVPIQPVAPAAPAEDPEEVRLREREVTLQKQREARAARLKELEREEEEARLAEEEYTRRRQALSTAKSPSPIPAVTSPPPPPVPAAQSVVSTPEAATTPSATGSTNPFSRLMGGTPSGTPSTSAPRTNPFFRADSGSTSGGAAAPPVPSAPPAPPAPAIASQPSTASKSSYHTAPKDDEDWGDISERDDEDSSDDEITRSRSGRQNLAAQLFKDLLPARPQSAGSSPQTPVSSSRPPTAPPPPQAPLAPPPPAAPLAPAVSAAPASGPSDRGALLSSIVGGAKLRKTVTNDRSGATLAGAVVGDNAPPAHITEAAQRPPAPIPARADMDAPSAQGHSHRQSVDWYADLAADHGQSQINPMPSHAEDDEEPTTPAIRVQDEEPTGSSDDPMSDIDRSVSLRVRTLYPYDGQREEDLSFGENVVLTANPSKSGGDWWYGMTIQDGKSGLFPSTYVVEFETSKAKAIYSYTGNSPDELPFVEGDELSIIDRNEGDWWKAEQGGVVFLVPAAYLEAAAASKSSPLLSSSAQHPLENETASAFPDVVGPRKEDGTSDNASFVSFEIDSDSDSDSDSESEEGNAGAALSEEQRAADRLAREHERQRMLEAAGLVVKADPRRPPPRPTRSRSKRQRRPAPAPPERPVSLVSTLSDRDLPPTPSDADAVDTTFKVDDAYERYQAFQRNEQAFNRLSTVSQSSASAQLSPIASIHRVPSRDPESRLSSGFKSLLGRRTPAEERLSTANISSPIISASTETPVRESSPAFGTNWGSLVDRSVLDGIPSRERQRQEAIFELVTTEAAYVRDLQLIVEVFYLNLVSVLNSKEITVVFANVEDLLLTNTGFLSSLEERQKDCRLFVDRIGDILDAQMPSMAQYMAYCVNQGTAIKALQSLREQKPPLQQKLLQLRDEPSARNLDLSSYLLSPMQRITRYPLLIRQILSYTEPSTERSLVESALGTAESILNAINESIREQENRERLKTISKDLWIGQGRLDLTAPTRNMGPRRLLKEGALAKAKSGRRLQVFLCSDVLVLTDEAAKSLYRMPIPLSELTVREIPGRRDDSTFQLSLAFPRGGEKIGLRAGSAKDCHSWMRDIEAASSKSAAADRRARREVQT